MRYLNKKLFLLLIVLLLGGIFFFFSRTYAANQNINVSATVPATLSGSGSPCTTNCNQPPTNPSPVISNVTTTLSVNSAGVNWSVSDDGSVSSVNFVYGTTESYGQTGTVSNSSSVSLLNLSSSTVYYYKISATDNLGAISNYASSFKTLSGQAQSDTTAPLISSISVTAGQTSAVISFNTNENSTSQINYGLTTNLGSNASGGNLSVANHQITVLGLTASTSYFYKIIATDTALNSTSTAILNFFTAKDTVAPPDVSDFKVTTGTSYLSLNWTNPSLSFTPDFSGVKVFRKTGSQATSPNDSEATLVYSGLAKNFDDTNIVNNTLYYYTVFSYDQSKNYSPGVFVSGKLNKIFAEICNNNVDDNGDSKVDCADPGCLNNSSCAPKTEVCNNDVDDNNDGKIDCADSACSLDQNCKIKLLSEICNNNLDDDNNSKIDCADPVCFNDINCKVVETQKAPESKGGSQSACSDGIDNDVDNLIDYPNDPGCTNLSDNDEYNPPASTVPTFEKLSLSKIKFFGGSHQIELFPKGNKVFGLSQSNLSLYIRKSVLIGPPESFILRVGDSEQHQFVLNSSGDTYYADTLFPEIGHRQAFVEINYGANQIDTLGVDLEGVRLGEIKDENGQKVSGVEVILYKENGEIFPASIYGQSNPQITNNLAVIGWMVPNGNFYLVAKRDGYYDYKSPVFSISDSIVNQTITLAKIPPKLLDVIDPNASLTANVVNVTKNLATKAKVSTVIAVQKIGDTAKVVQQVAADPAVKETANKVVAPAAVSVAAVSTATVVSWADILPLLRFLFLQPVLILGRGKREKWGIVYNALSKLPVDLALVRLVNIQTGKIIQTKVTSSDGRYFFLVNAGKYRLEVKKGNFVFPSNLLKDFQVDGQRSDIYHGEEIVVSEKATVITANIPLDPAGEGIKTPRRLMLAKALRHIQSAVSWIGFVVTALALYISPTWYMWVLLGVHLGLTFIFKRLSKVPPAKGWGIVYDENTRKPLGNVVARLFDSKFNKLVATEITSADGKYYFVAGENQYYISYDHEGYQSEKTAIIDLKGKEVDTVAKDVGLKKK